MNILDNQPLQELNSFGFQHRAEKYVELNDSSDALAAVDYCRQHDLPLTIIGEGSNLVVRDDIAGLTVRWVNDSTSFKEYDDADSVSVVATAGVNWHSFVQHTIGEGAFGLENLSLIPGSVGAAPVQNIGAYGVELSSCVEHIECIDLDSGELLSLAVDECEFAYRDSLFKRSTGHAGLSGEHSLNKSKTKSTGTRKAVARGSNTPAFLIVSVHFKLSRTFTPQLQYRALQDAVTDSALEQPTASDVARLVCAIRQSKLPDPAKIGNAGSFFKNPIVEADKIQDFQKNWPDAPAWPQADGSHKVAAGWLIEQAGWKGQTFANGRVGVYDKQALVLINVNDGTADELLALAQQIRDDVNTKFGLQLVQDPGTIP